MSVDDTVDGLATVLEDGRLDISGQVNATPDQAAVAAAEGATDGWRLWLPTPTPDRDRWRRSAHLQVAHPDEVRYRQVSFCVSLMSTPSRSALRRRCHPNPRGLRGTIP